MLFYHSHTELNVGDDNVMIVGVVLENKAQDSAYPGEVIVTYPSIIDYEGSSQVVGVFKVITLWLRSF